MNEYRVIYKNRIKIESQLILANSKEHAQEIFENSIKEKQKPFIMILQINEVVTTTEDFIFDYPILLEFLREYVRKINTREKKFNYVHKSSMSTLKRLIAFANEHYFSLLKITLTSEEPK